MIYRSVHYETLPSTNDLLLELAQKGAPEGLVVWTDFQTQGRGRFQRVWQSGRKKGLLFSLLLRPQWSTNQLPLITQLMAKVIQNVLDSKVGIKSTLKRPNDILVNKHKICGILTETRSRGSKTEFVVVGVGLNVLSVPKAMTTLATSIYQESQKKIAIEELLQWILEEFKHSYDPQKA
jgi:BirA family biotin operon repressor/biotin-[acetyl-CoA-carboxylase] ligase